MKKKKKESNFMLGKCYDCGSTVPKHHTKLCGLADPGAIRDLPSKPGTQWWNEKKKA